jgi:hypothetical protein
LRAAALEALAAYRAALRAVNAATDALTATFTAEQRELWHEYKEAEAEESGLGDWMEHVEQMRHLPGLAPILQAVYQDHPLANFNSVGRCCTEIAPPLV